MRKSNPDKYGLKEKNRAVIIKRILNIAYVVEKVFESHSWFSKFLLLYSTLVVG